MLPGRKLERPGQLLTPACSGDERIWLGTTLDGIFKPDQYSYALLASSVGGNPPVAMGPQRSIVTRSSDLS